MGLGGGVVRRDEITRGKGDGGIARRGWIGSREEEEGGEGGGGWYQTALTSSHTIVYTIVLVG